MTRRPVFVFVLLCAVCLSLSACSTIGDLFSSSDDDPLPGERRPVLGVSPDLQPLDPVAAEAEFAAAPPWRNDFWPQAGGYSTHVMQHLQLGTDPLDEIWEVSIGRGGSDRLPLTAQPIVAEGRVYTKDAEMMVRAFSAETGEALWRRNVRPEEEDDLTIGGGISYGDGKLYVTNGYRHLVAIGPTDGSVLWTVRLPAPARAAPTIMSGRVIVQTMTGELMAFNSADGAFLWSYQGDTEASGLVGAAAPAVDSNIVVAGFSSGQILGLRPENGAVAWSDTLAPRQRLGGMSSLADIVAPPVIDGELVIAIGFGGRMMAFEIQSGRRVWQREIGGVNMPWVAGNGVFVVNNDQELVALSRESGNVRWVTDLQALTDEDDPVRWTGPLLGGGRLLLASTDGDLVSLDPLSGAVLSQDRIGNDIRLPPVIAAETLYLLSENGRLSAYR